MQGSSLLLLAVEEEAKNPLIPNVNELVWGTICFAIFAGFMIRFVLPKAREALEQRTADIEGKLETAERDRAQAQELLRQYEQQLAEAREEAGRIRTEAQSERAAIVEEARAEARTEATRITELASAHLSSEREQVLVELRRSVGTMAVDLASRILGDSLEEEVRQRGTVDRYLDELEATSARAVTATGGSGS